MLAGGGYDLGLLLDGDADRAGAADERGTFVHQLQVTGSLMYYLAEHRGWRDPVVVSVNNTSMAARLGEHYGIATHETPVGFKFIGPKMIETGRDDGRRGVRRLRVRDAPARARRRVRRPAPARPVPARARRPGDGRCRAPSSSSTSSPDRRSTAGSTSMSSDPRTPRRSGGCSSTSRRRQPAELAGRAGQRGSMPLDTGDGFKFFLADGSWLLVRASGHRAARPGLHGGDVRGDPRADAGRPASGWSAARERGRDRRRSPGRQALGPRADLGAHGPIRGQDPRDRGRQAAQSPAPPGEGRIRSSCRRAAPALRSRTMRASSQVEELGPGEPPARPDRADPPLRGDRTVRARSRFRPPSSTTSSASRTTSAARARPRRRPDGLARCDSRIVATRWGRIRGVTSASDAGVRFGHATAITGRGA